MPELTSLTKGNAMNQIPLTLHDLEYFVRARPIVIIRLENEYRIGKVNSIEFEEGKCITLYLKTLLGMCPTFEGRWKWSPVPNSLKEDYRLQLPYPFMVSFENSLTFMSPLTFISLGTLVSLSLNGGDTINYESLKQRYDKLKNP